MQPIVITHRSAISTPVTNTLTVPVAAGADTTRRALRQLDLSGPAIRAMRALGLTDRVTLTPGGLSWRPEGWSGQIDVGVDVRVEPDREGGLIEVTRVGHAPTVPGRGPQDHGARASRRLRLPIQMITSRRV